MCFSCARVVDCSRASTRLSFFVDALGDVTRGRVFRDRLCSRCATPARERPSVTSAYRHVKDSLLRLILERTVKVAPKGFVRDTQDGLSL